MSVNLMAILVFSGVLSVPSAVFAEASWYASLRAGVESSGGNLAVKDGASRWGIRGSAEAGEGLTAVYRFEHKITTPDAAQPGGRLSYVGLSGSFGTVTVGQIWNAAYNSVGAITDNSWYYGDAQTGYRHGNAVSYAFSNDLMSLQVDAIYGSSDSMFNANSNKVPDRFIKQNHATTATPAVSLDEANNARNTQNLQKVEFGLTVNVSDLGKVAFAHINDKYVLSPKMQNEAGDTPIAPTSWETKSTLVAAEVSVADLAVYIGSGRTKYTNTTLGGTDAADEPADMTKADAKTTFFGFSGGFGDTGVSYLFQWRDVKSTNRKPWVLSLTKGLGDSASLVLEHGNNDGASDNQTQLGLVVSF